MATYNRVARMGTKNSKYGSTQRYGFEKGDQVKVVDSAGETIAIGVAIKVTSTFVTIKDDRTAPARIVAWNIRYVEAVEE